MLALFEGIVLDSHASLTVEGSGVVERWLSRVGIVNPTDGELVALTDGVPIGGDSTIGGRSSTRGDAAMAAYEDAELRTGETLLVDSEISCG